MLVICDADTLQLLECLKKFCYQNELYPTLPTPTPCVRRNNTFECQPL